MIARPARVRWRARKPCLRERRRLLGWKVRFMGGPRRCHSGTRSHRSTDHGRAASSPEARGECRVEFDGCRRRCTKGGIRPRESTVPGDAGQPRPASGPSRAPAARPSGARARTAVDAAARPRGPLRAPASHVPQCAVPAHRVRGERRAVRSCGKPLARASVRSLCSGPPHRRFDARRPLDADPRRTHGRRPSPPRSSDHLSLRPNYPHSVDIPVESLRRSPRRVLRDLQATAAGGVVPVTVGPLCPSSSSRPEPLWSPNPPPRRST